MKENYVDVPLLQQREIEIRVLGPIVQAFADEIGKDGTYDIVRRTMQSISHKIGSAAAEQHGGGLESLKSNCIAKWNSGGELEKIIREDSADTLRFDVTRCDFARLYEELGYLDIGPLISCDRDSAFIEGFDPDIELIREKTLMTGDAICDFCYRKRKK